MPARDPEEMLPPRIHRFRNQGCQVAPSFALASANEGRSNHEFMLIKGNAVQQVLHDILGGPVALDARRHPLSYLQMETGPGLSRSGCKSLQLLQIHQKYTDAVLHRLCSGSPRVFKHLNVQTGVWWDLSSSRRFLCSVSIKPFPFSPRCCI